MRTPLLHETGPAFLRRWGASDGAATHSDRLCFDSNAYGEGCMYSTSPCICHQSALDLLPDDLQAQLELDQQHIVPYPLANVLGESELERPVVSRRVSVALQNALAIEALVAFLILAAWFIAEAVRGGRW